MTALVNEDNLSDSLTETEVALLKKLESNQILSMTQQFDQLRLYEDIDMVLAQNENFGGVFSKENRKNYENIALLNAIEKRLKELRNSNVNNVLARVAQEGARALLSEEEQVEIEEIQTQIKNTREQIEIASTAYQKVLVFNKLLPSISKLLEDRDPITSKRILELYYQVEILEVQVSIIDTFLKSTPNVLLESIFTNDEISKIQEEIKKYRSLEKFSSDTYKMFASKQISQEDMKKRLEAYSQLRRDYFINQFPNLESEVKNVTTKLRSFERKIIDHFGSLQKFVAQITVNAVIETEEILKTHTSTDYIDVFPKGKSIDNSMYWLRIQLPAGSLALLREGHDLDNMTGALSLVYKPEFTENNIQLEGNTFLPDVTFTDDQKELLYNSLTKVVADVPLGIQVSGLRLLLDSDTNLPVVFQGHDSDDRPLNNLSVTLPKESPWTNFKNNLEIQRELFNNLQVGRQLGLRIEKITVDPIDFDLKLTFRTETESIIRNLLSLESNANTFEISLKEIENTNGILTDNLRTIIGKQIAKRLDTIIKDEEHTDVLKNILIAERIEAAEVLHMEDQIVGRIRFLPKGFSTLEETFQVNTSAELLFKTEIKNGRSSVHLSNVFLPFEVPVRQYLTSFLEQKEKELKKSITEEITDTEFGKVLFNLAEEVQFSKFQLSVDQREIRGVMTLPNLFSGSLNVIISDNRIVIEDLEDTLKKIVNDQIENLIKSQFTEPLEQNCKDLLQNKKITLYTFDFEVTDVNCDLSQSNVTAKAVYVEAPDNYATLRLKTDGTFNIESFKAPIIKEKILEKITSELAAFSNFKYLEIKDPRFEKGILVIDAYIKLELLDVYEKVGQFEISPDNKNILEATFSGVNIQTAFESKINDYVKQSFEQLIKKDLLKLEFSKEANGLYVTDIEKVQLFQDAKEIIFWGEAKLKGITVPEFKITINLSANDLLKAIKIELPEDAVINALLQNATKMTNLGGEIVPGLSVKILELYPQIGPLRLEGSVELKLNRLTFPAMKFTVTEKEIRFYPTLSFPLPGEYAISVSPPLTIFGSSVSLDLDEKKIILGTNVTVGAPGVAEANSKLINLEGNLSAYYTEGNFGSMDLEANLFLITVLKVMEGKGQIDTSKGCFSMSSRTVGPLREVLKYDNGVAINCNKELLRSETEMAVLGVSLETVVTAIKNGDVIGLNGEGRFNFIDIGKMHIKVGTTLEIGDPNSVMKNAFVYLDGRIDVGDFNIARATVDADYYRALLSFEVLGIPIAIDAPSINDFSEGMILEEILQLLEFDPEALLEILKDPTKISFKMAPMGPSGPDGGGNDRNDNPNNSSDSTSRNSAPPGSGVEDGNGEDNAGSAQSSSVPITGGKVKTSSQGLYKEGYTLKVLNRQDIKRWGFEFENLNNTWPSNVQKAIVLEDRNGNHFDVRYINDNVSRHFNSNFRFWKTDFNNVKYKQDEEGIDYYYINKERFSINLGALSWRIALAPTGEGYVFLEHNNLNLYQYEFQEFKEFKINELQGSWDHVSLFLRNYQIYKLNGKNFNPRRFNPYAVGRNNGAYYQTYAKPEQIYVKNGNKFQNIIGEDFEDLDGVKDKFFKRIEKHGVDLQNISALVFLDSHILVVEKDDFIKAQVLKNRPSNEVKTELETFSAAVGSVYVKLPKSELNAIFNGEPWYNPVNNFKDNISRLASNYQGEIGSVAFKKFLVLIEGLIEDPTQIPSIRTFNHAGRQFLVSKSLEGIQKTLMDLSPDSNTWMYIDRQDLFDDLGVVSMDHNQLADRFKNTPLIANTFIHIMDRKIPFNMTYLGKEGNQLFFYDDGGRLLIQSHNEVINTTSIMYLNTSNNVEAKKKGNLYTKASYVKMNVKFFEEILKNIDTEKEVQVLVEDTEGYPVAYMLDQDQFTIVWENKIGSIDTLVYNRKDIDAALLKSTIPKAKLKLITTIDSTELKYDLEELVQFLKLGYGDTKSWFGPNKDQVHPLSILK